ncbi:MAG: ATP-binding cassette subfamily B protein RaxB, partial [Candidatus Azotimanducaceae bacterium]
MSEGALNGQKLLEFSSRRRVPLILQAEVAECGLASMAMVASYHGYEVDLPALRKRFSAHLKGMNLQQLNELGDSLGLMGRALKCPIENVSDLSLPCILHWDMNHFIVLTRVDRSGFTINDPAKGKIKLKHEEFGRRFTGIALELIPGSSFKPKVEKKRMRINQLWSKMTGLKFSLVKLLVLSLVMQLFALMSPYYMQWVVDEVLVSRDQSLLVILAIGFAILKVIAVVTGATRSWLVIRLSSVLNMQMGVNLLRHLLRLPMSFFESRHVGDIVSRFGSLAQIRERITTGLVETVVDGIMSVTVLCVMFMYSARLTVVVLIAVAAYGLLRFLLFQPLHAATEDAIQCGAKEQSNFLESVRGIQAIKLFSNESQRQGIWQNRFAEVINAEIRLGKLEIGFASVHQLLIGFESVIVVYLAAQLVIANQISIGMVLAFIAYKNQFGASAIGLIEQFIEFKMMRLHLDRISDIALHEQEPYQGNLLPLANIEGEL